MKALTRSSAPLLVLIAACATTAEDEGPATAPTPYTAAEIRGANPAGTVLVYRIEQTGAPTVVRTMRFVRADADGARIESSLATEGGEPVGEPDANEAAWTELRDHAAFPEDRTIRSRTSCTVPDGTYDCVLYTVTGAEDGIPILSRFWFAFRKPGPPVLLEIEKEGAISFRMELLEYRRP